MTVAEPKSTGEAIQVIRAAIYDMTLEARTAGIEFPKVTRNDIQSYCLKRKWATPVSIFDKAMARLIEAGAADGTMTDYWLTARGDLEEEERRRPWASRLLDEIRKPATVVDLIKLLIGFALGLLSGVVLGRS